MSRPLDADEIAPFLWQGSLPTPGPAVREAGFQVLVLCAREYQLKPEEFPGVRVIHAPNDDSVMFPLTREKLGVAVGAAREVADAVRTGKKALVTCAAGLNRSGLVSALTLHLLNGWAGDHCVAVVRKFRPRSRVHPGRTLRNADFLMALNRLPRCDVELTPDDRFKRTTSLWVPR